MEVEKISRFFPLVIEHGKFLWFFSVVGVYCYYLE
nr:MAG TPA: hypothetical protein [Caudoviricetes sp.]